MGATTATKANSTALVKRTPMTAGTIAPSATGVGQDESDSDHGYAMAWERDAEDPTGINQLGFQFGDGPVYGRFEWQGRGSAPKRWKGFIPQGLRTQLDAQTGPRRFARSSFTMPNWTVFHEPSAMGPSLFHSFAPWSMFTGNTFAPWTMLSGMFDDPFDRSIFPLAAPSIFGPARRRPTATAHGTAAATSPWTQADFERAVDAKADIKLRQLLNRPDFQGFLRHLTSLFPTDTGPGSKDTAWESEYWPAGLRARFEAMMDAKRSSSTQGLGGRITDVTEEYDAEEVAATEKDAKSKTSSMPGAFPTESEPTAAAIPSNNRSTQNTEPADRTSKQVVQFDDRATFPSKGTTTVPEYRLLEAPLTELPEALTGTVPPSTLLTDRARSTKASPTKLVVPSRPTETTAVKVPKDRQLTSLPSMVSAAA